MKIFFSFLLFSLFSYSLFAEPNKVYTGLLQDYVSEGNVDYQNLCLDQRLQKYISFLSVTDPESLPDDQARLAFWLNAYNAYTLKVICDNYPVRSINELHRGGLILGSLIRQTVWHRQDVVINGENTSLNDIEHEIIRKNFEEPRIHFALVCAAKGCPPLRDEAYLGEKIDFQLQEQGKTFLQQEEKNRVDRERRIIYLSPIFSWFRSDFKGSRESIIKFILPFLSEDERNLISENLNFWRIRYTRYDWNLNEK